MNYRTTKLLAEKSLTTTGTHTIDLNIKDIISRIIIAWRVSMSGYGMDSYAYRDITKIELVDGSDVLHSMNGGENQALCIYDRKCPTMNHGQYVNAASAYTTFGIDFGRFLHDPELALDPSKFRNLQLKITYDVDVMDTGNTTGYLEVLADCFDEKMVSPVGFLMAKEHYSWSLSAAGAYEYIDLPTDHPIRKMLIRGYKVSREPWYQVIEARLDEDNEKRIPFDWDLEDYHRIMKGVWTPVEEPFYGYADTSGTYHYYLTPTDYFAVLIGHILGGTVQGAPTGVTPGGDVTLNAGTAGNFHGVARGYLPNHCFEFPFGDPLDMADWYDVTRVGSLRLRLKSGTGTSGDVGVVLQQLRRY